MQRLLAHGRAILSVVRRRPFDTTTPEGRSNERYRRIALTTAANFVARGASVVVGMLVVPITLGYLGKAQYGLWMAITAFVAWAALFDFGLLNGLVNRIAESYGRDDRDAARAYFSSALVLLTGAATVLLIAAFVAFPLVPWRHLFAVRDGLSDREIGLSVVAALGCAAFAMPLAVVRQVYVGYQRAYVGALFSVGGSVAMLVGVVAGVRLGASLPVLVFLLGGPGVIAVAANLVWMLGREMPWLRPSLRTISVPAIRRLVSTSTPMFLFQVGALLVNETQAIVLAHRTGLEVVAEYSIVWRVYVLAVGLVSMATASFAPAFREAYERGERGWCVRSFRRILELRMGLALGGSAVLAVAGNVMLRVWLRRSDVQFSTHVWLVLAAMCIVAVWAAAFGEILNIMDRVWPQVWMVIAQGAATVALTAILGARFGVLGALLAIAVPGFLLSGWIMPVLARRFLNESQPSSRVPAAETVQR